MKLSQSPADFAGSFDAAFSVPSVSLFGDAVRTGLGKWPGSSAPEVWRIAHWADFAAPAILVMLHTKAAVLGQPVTRPPALTESDLVDHFDQLGLGDFATGSMIFIDVPISPGGVAGPLRTHLWRRLGNSEFRRDSGGKFREAFACEARTAEGTDLMTAHAPIT